MIDNRVLEQRINKHFEGTTFFMISLSVSPDNHISVVVDGDAGVTVADCISLTKVLEQELDRDTDDFSLEVSSYGVGNPLLMPRQYIKNTGRLLEVQLSDGKVYTGKIVQANNTSVELELVPVNKRGRIIQPEVPYLTFEYEQITQAIIQIAF